MNLVPVGEVCDLRNGRAFKPTEWSKSGTPIIRIQNLNDETKPFNYCDFEVDSKFHVASGDLLFSWSGTPGTSFGAFFWRRGRGYLNQHIFRIDPHRPEELNLEYFRLALNQKLNEIISQAHGGVGLQHITKEKLNKIKVYLPTLDDQIRIAYLLGKVEGLIAQRKQNLQQLDDLVKSVFLEMFGDPVRNERAWPTKDLDSFIDQNRGISYGIVQRGDNFPGGIPVLRIRDIIAEEYVEEDLVRTDPSNSNKYSRSILQGGELLLSIRGTVGAISVAPLQSVGWNVSREIAVIPVLNGVSKKYLTHLLKSAPMQRQLSLMIKGVAQSGLNLSDIRRIGVILPPADLQASYEQIAMKIESQVRAYRKSLTDLEILYGALSQSAFKGELDLSRVALHASASEGERPVAATLPTPIITRVIELPETDLLQPALQDRAQVAPLLHFWLEAYRTQLGGEDFSLERFIAAAQTRLAELHPDNDFEWSASDYESIKAWVFEALAAGALTQAFDDDGNRVELKAAAEQSPA